MIVKTHSPSKVVNKHDVSLHIPWIIQNYSTIGQLPVKCWSTISKEFFFSIIYSGKEGNKSLTTKQWKRDFISLKHILIVNWQKLLSHPCDEKAASATCTLMFVFSCIKYRKKNAFQCDLKACFKFHLYCQINIFLWNCFLNTVQLLIGLFIQNFSPAHTILKESITHVDINNSL